MSASCSNEQERKMSVEAFIEKVRAAEVPLQDQLDMLRDQFECNILPPEIAALVRKSRDDLIASGQARKALKAGDAAPRFSLPDLDGNMVRSDDLLTRGSLMLTF